MIAVLIPTPVMARQQQHMCYNIMESADRSLELMHSLSSQMGWAACFQAPLQVAASLLVQPGAQHKQQLLIEAVCNCAILL